MIAAAGGGGVLISLAMRGLDQWATAPSSAKSERIARETPAIPEPAALVVAPPQAVAAAPPPETTHTIAKVRATPAPVVKSVKLQKPGPPELGAPQPQWTDRQTEYRLAKDAYDASERAEGFRWAQQYKVRTRRYCRTLEQQRTAAFMEGCLSYAAGAAQADPG